MSVDMPPDPDMDDDLEQAYAQAHALAGDGGGPAASVRANVLAIARAEAEQARTRAAAAVALAPVASPVADVGRGRAMAVNLSSWRVRSGAAVCAAMLVALGLWRFDESRHVGGGVQVATANLELAAAPTSTIPQDLPLPPLAAASVPYLPPPVVDDPLATKRLAEAASAKSAVRDGDRDVVVAQADQAERSLRSAPAPEPRTDSRRAVLAAAPPAREATAGPPPAAPVAAAPEAPPEQAPATVTISGVATPPQLATLPPMPPSVVPRRVPVAPPVATAAAAAPPGDVQLAGGDTTVQRVAITGSSIKRVDASAAASASLEMAPRAKLAMAGTPTAAPRATGLQAAADRGDLEALRSLLADPAAQVDAPDAAGRTALLHAVLGQQAGAVRLLLGAGADPQHADASGLTPRAAAQAGASAEIAALLAPSR